MATIVVHRQSGHRFVLVGTGYAATETATPGVFLGNLSPNVEAKHYGMAAVCDAHGAISWVASSQLIVLEVDGVSPDALVTP